MIRFGLLYRQIAAAGHQGAIFALCVALSLVTLVSLGSFSRGVHSSLLQDAQTLHGADLILRSRSPFPPELASAVADQERNGALTTARIYEFHSVVRTFGGERTLLSHIKVVEPGYPFYGRVELASGRPFPEVLRPGSLVVEEGLLQRLGLRIGDRLRVGEALLTIADVVVHEPDRPVDIFALGPRVFVAAADLQALELIGPGSRVSYRILAKVRDPKALDTLVATLRQAAAEERVRIDSFRTADSRVRRFFDNLLFFLNLTGVFTLLLAGIGIQSSLGALLREQEKTIAIMKALGARSRFILHHYFAAVAILGLAGTGIGLAGAWALQNHLPRLFRGLLPEGTAPAFSATAVGEGLLLGFGVVSLFTLLPLLNLREVKPRAILGRETVLGGSKRGSFLVGGALALLFLGLLFLRLGRIRTGLVFLAVLGLLLLVAFLLATALLALLKRRAPERLSLRQALRGLFRPRNASRAILVTLSLAFGALFSITLVEKNLDASFIQSFPEENPNLFFLDIQPAQQQDFLRELGFAATCYPVVRGSVVAVNNEKIDPERERRRPGDNLGREFNLTYRSNLLPHERLSAGKSLFRSDWEGLQVSVLDRVAEMRDLAVGDTITFRIHGLPLTARVASLRTRTEKGLHPFFYFVFPEGALAEAPKTFFAAARVAKEQIPALQNRVVARFPNISVIDVTAAVAIFGRLMEKLSAIVRFFTLFSIAAGLAIIVGSIFATRYARIRETVYYKILGARRSFVLAVFAFENLLLGFISSVLGALLAQGTSWLICRQGLDLGYRPFPGTSLGAALAATAAVVAIGLAASLPILRHKPALFLREQADE
ncbi:MAG: ABC transporter permease [Deltaproteobacteria bacterium]|nr:ABC transporter permease [Deltaproteobacteria bacterium]